MNGFVTAVVGVDRSPASEPLLECVADLRSWGVERVVLVHVVTVRYGQFGGFGHEQEYRDWLDEWSASLAREGFDVAIDVVASGAPADELVSAARRHGADLLMVGSRSDNLVRRLFLGSVTRRVLQLASVPVLIERIEPTAAGTEQLCESVCQTTLGRVVLATDGSEGSRGAEDAAERLAGRAGVIEVVTVREPNDVRSEPAMRAHLDALAERLRAVGGTATVRILEGDAAEQLTRMAEQQGASLLILGRHGRNRLTEQILGHTAELVSERTRLPVLLVPGD